MSRSFALLVIVAFALSAPLNARTLLATGEAQDSIESAPAVGDKSEDLRTSARNESAADASGGMPDTSASVAEATTTYCCWTYYLGRWWCMPCE